MSARKLSEEGLDCRDAPGEAAVAVVEVQTEQVGYLCKGNHNLAGAEIISPVIPTQKLTLAQGIPAPNLKSALTSTPGLVETRTPSRT